MSETFGNGGPARFAVGDRVTTTRALRQDGTFPDPEVAVGQVLVEAGVAGQVMDIGVYLNEHLVYAVAFDSGRIVGCLERELTDETTDDAHDALATSRAATDTPADAVGA